MRIHQDIIDNKAIGSIGGVSRGLLWLSRHSLQYQGNEDSQRPHQNDLECARKPAMEKTL